MKEEEEVNQFGKDWKMKTYLEKRTQEKRDARRPNSQLKEDASTHAQAKNHGSGFRWSDQNWVESVPVGSQKWIDWITDSEVMKYFL